MNVAVDARMAVHGGIGTYLQNLLPRMAAARPRWAFTLLGEPDVMTSLGWGALANVRMRRCRASYYTIAEQLELPLRVPADADVYWAPHYNVPVALAKPLVVTVHDVCHLALPDATGGWLKQRYARFMFRRVARLAAGVAFDSAFSRDEMARFATVTGRSVVAPLAVDHAWFDAKANAPERPLAARYLVYVGNWKRHKNVPGLLRAFGKVRDRIPQRLVLVGRSEGLNADPDIGPALTALGDRVVLAGEVDAPSLRRWVAHADALVSASRYEGFGLPPLEAMAAGCACMVSRAGSLPEVCGDAALYCDPADEADIANRIVDIATDAPLRARLIERGRVRAGAFEWDRCVATTLELLEHAA